MANAWGKVRRKVIVAIEDVPQGRTLEGAADDRRSLQLAGINPDLTQELQGMLYDQLSQFTTGDLRSDLRIAGPARSFELQESDCLRQQRTCTAPGTG